MMHFVRTFSIMRAEGTKLIAIEKVRNYGKIVYIQNTFENGWWEDVYHWPSSYPHRSAPGHELPKPSNKSGIFQLLGTISVVLFY